MSQQISSERSKAALKEEIKELELLERKEEIYQRLSSINGPRFKSNDEEVPIEKVDAHWDNLLKEMVKMYTALTNLVNFKFIPLQLKLRLG